MSWTVINDTLCTQCTICAQICPGCYHMENKRMISTANAQTCILCGKCVGICPEGAIVHEKMNMANFPRVAAQNRLDSTDLIQFIRERRAHRIFKNKPIPRADLELLVDTARYTPTGHNAMDVEIVLVQSPERIKQLSDLAVDYQAVVLAQLEKKIKVLKAKQDSTPADITALEGRAGFLQMIVNTHAAGFDPIFYKAGAVMIFHATAKEITPKDDCVIAATTVGLLARTLGLESTFIAMFEWAANAHPPLQKALALPENNNVFSVLVLGYPKFKYQRAVDRKPIRVRWE